MWGCALHVDLTVVVCALHVDLTVVECALHVDLSVVVCVYALCACCACHSVCARTYCVHVQSPTVVPMEHEY